MSLTTLEDLFMEDLKDIYNAEKQLLKALPKMAKAASDATLRKAFEAHLKETKGQVARLEKAFAYLEMPARGKKCAAMEGLIEEGSELMEEAAEEAVMDAGLICAAQKVEHYEIATYGTLATWAETLGHGPVAKLLKANLAEEEAADEKLSAIAANVNQAAHQEPVES